MAWEITDPTNTIGARPTPRLVEIGIEYFPDRIDYEGILGRDMPAEHRAGLVILATARGAADLRRLAESGLALDDAVLRKAPTRLAFERQVVVLRWAD